MMESLVISFLGSLAAAVLSWDRSHNLRWALWHATLGWASVVYLLIVGGIGVARTARASRIEDQPTVTFVGLRAKNQDILAS
jgi:hypothetical protein